MQHLRQCRLPDVVVISLLLLPFCPNTLLALRLRPRWTDGSGVLIVRVNDIEGTVCPDSFSLLEATVACRDLQMGWARYVRRFPRRPTLDPAKHLVRVIRCRGNESWLGECQSYAIPQGVPCRDNATVVGIRCVRALPDLLVDKLTLQMSAYLQIQPIYQLTCALEENCLAPSADPFRNQSLQFTKPHSRALLRFSSIISNKGTAEFLPHLPPTDWQWHQCHEHYHSMDYFTLYEVRRFGIQSTNEDPLAVGHKASFCLEDNACPDGIRPRFNCSRNPVERGSQGITPGCKDTYLHDIDCQWIDISDLPYGYYLFRLVVNPEFRVAELSYANNGIACMLDYRNQFAQLSACHYIHPYDFW